MEDYTLFNIRHIKNLLDRPLPQNVTGSDFTGLFNDSNAEVWAQFYLNKMIQNVANYDKYHSDKNYLNKARNNQKVLNSIIIYYSINKPVTYNLTDYSTTGGI